MRALVPLVALGAVGASAPAALVVLAALVACGDNQRPASPPTPEQVAATAVDGARVSVEGTVHALTFDNRPTDGSFPLLPDRFLLLRSVRPPGVTTGELELGALREAWGLGVRLPAATLAHRTLPQIGDRVAVTGTFRQVAWAGTTVPVLEDAQVRLVGPTLRLGQVGAACAHDLDCHDRLVCDGATARCAPPAVEVTWGEAWRNLHGTCTTDADCPPPLVCDPRYTTATTGPYAPPYFVARDGGKHLCVARDDAAFAELCPRTVTTADVIGGRFATGKLVCLRAAVWLPVAAPDGDTHLQMLVDEPLPYPAADGPYYLAGMASEISPPYKDPARPQGALLDPALGAVVTLVGTTRYDEDHGWFEVHSVTAYATVAPGPGAAAFMARYPTHPGVVDWEEVEAGHVFGPWHDEAEAARDLEQRGGDRDRDRDERPAAPLPAARPR